VFWKRVSWVVRASLVLVSLAVPTWSQSLPIPDRGALRLVMPPEWKEVQRDTPSNLPPTLSLARTGTQRGSLQVTVFWSPKNEPEFVSLPQIRAFCLRGQTTIKGSTIEQELPLQTLTGNQGAGFFYDATDKDYKAPQGDPLPGEFPILTHGELGLGEFLLSFTIMSDAKQDAAVKEALAALQSAVVQRAVAGPSFTKVQGAGVEVELDLAGYEQKEGLKHHHEAYYQLGFFGAKGLNLSILVDDLNGMSLGDLEKAGIGQSQGSAKILPGGKVKSEAIEQPKGFLISYPGDLGAPQFQGYFQAQWYFETIHQGKWLELHFSKVMKLGDDLQPIHAEVERIVRSIQPAAPAPAASSPKA